jgi:hypothetical protein
MPRKDAVLDRTVFELKEADPMQQARRLVSLGVEKVVCGGIQRRFKDWLIGKGVAVMDNQRGRAEDLIQALFCNPIKAEETGMNNTNQVEKDTQIEITYCVE